MKIRTIQQLQDLLDEDFGWRVKEIANFKSALANSQAKAALVRAGVALIYAHLEGFVKFASTAYLDFISTQRVRYSELRHNFLSLAFRRDLQELSASRNDRTNAEIIRRLLSCMNDRATVAFPGAIRTESNLSYQVLSQILFSLGIDETQYSTREKLLNEEILKKRNEIAHGEYRKIEESDFKEYSDVVLVLMRMFKADVENGSSGAQYLVASP